MEVKGSKGGIPSLLVPSVGECEGVSRLNICGVITQGAGVSPGYAYGKCLFRIVTPWLTHRQCEESIYCRFELSLTEEIVIKNRTEPSI